MGVDPEAVAELEARTGRREGPASRVAIQRVRSVAASPAIAAARRLRLWVRRRDAIELGEQLRFAEGGAAAQPVAVLTARLAGNEEWTERGEAPVEREELQPRQAVLEQPLVPGREPRQFRRCGRNGGDLCVGEVVPVDALDLADARIEETDELRRAGRLPDDGDRGRFEAPLDLPRV